MQKFNFGSFLIAAILLLIGGFIAGFLTPMFPMSLTGWAQGFVIALIQAFVLMLAMFSGKINLQTILISTIVIFVAGIAGGFLIDYIGLTGLIATLAIVMVQAIALTWAGVIKGKGKLF